MIYETVARFRPAKCAADMIGFPGWSERIAQTQNEGAWRPAKRGTIMVSGKAWRLVSPGERVFKATLVKKVKIGAETVAIFRVWNLPD
ncbi:MAG: hypothetical protein ABSF54_18355 [Bryobacteraceae bacterium]